MMQRVIKQSIGNIAQHTLLPFLLRRKTVIFTFHRVLTPSDYEQCQFGRSIVVTDTGLSAFIKHIKQHFQVIALSEFILDQNPPEQKPAKPRAVITFDDGWRDNYTVGLPVLREHQVPATVFLSTNHIGSLSGFWWQHLGEILSSPTLDSKTREAIKKKTLDILGNPKGLTSHDFHNVDALIEIIKRKYYDKAIELTEAIAELTGNELEAHGLSWEQCHEMSEQGIEFGSHTLSHSRLSLLEKDEIRMELEESRQLLKKHNIRYVDAICYPYGDYDQRTLTEAAQHYQAGLTTDSGIVSAGKHQSLRLPRINVSEEVAKNSGLLSYRLMKAAIKRQNHG